MLECDGVEPSIDDEESKVDEDESIDEEDERVRKGREGVEGEGEGQGELSRNANRRPERYHCCEKMDAREYSGIEYCKDATSRMSFSSSNENERRFEG